MAKIASAVCCFRQRLGAVGFAVIGVAPLELVALDKRAREGQREVDERDARGGAIAVNAAGLPAIDTASDMNESKTASLARPSEMPSVAR